VDAGVELGLVTDKIWAAFVERHRLALETGSDQQVRQILGIDAIVGRLEPAGAERAVL
jgi:hypothetical protein